MRLSTKNTKGLKPETFITVMGILNAPPRIGQIRQWGYFSS